jgi:uncharacterized protein YqhQ
VRGYRSVSILLSTNKKVKKLAEQPTFTYGGQAVIEGVMIRGRDHFSLAVRRQDGSISHTHEPVNPVFTGRIRRIPFLRGALVLTETLMLGVKALHLSGSMAIADQQKETNEEMPGWVLGATLTISLTLGIGLFFILPLLLVRFIDPFIASDLVSNVVEGLLRLAILVGYVWAIGFMKDIKRVFAYHGAEHMAVHTYEAGLPLRVDNVRKFGTPHPRCGTAFLLTVMLVSIVVFAFLGRPELEWRILSRILLIPVIAAVSYEIIRFSGVHQNWWLAQMLAWPGLLLQYLTTRPPNDDQIEVAITAMEAAIAADTGEEYNAWFPPLPVDIVDARLGEPMPGPTIDPQ